MNTGRKKWIGALFPGFLLSLLKFVGFAVSSFLGDSCTKDRGWWMRGDWEGECWVRFEPSMEELAVAEDLTSIQHRTGRNPVNT
jgi:hypothetical protein